MGERLQATSFQATFNQAVRVEPARTEMTEDAGALVLREAAAQLGLCGMLGRLIDPRNEALVTHPQVELVLTRLLLTALGWGDQDDADTLRSDPALRVAVSERRGTRPLDPPRRLEPAGLASQPTHSRQLGTLAVPENLDNLRGILLDVGKARLRAEGVSKELVLDVDSFPLSAHGWQEGAVYNGHYHDNILHPLAVFAHTGDLLAIEQRAGNAHTAKNVREVLDPVLTAMGGLAETLWVRMDAGFAAGPFFDWLDGRGVQWVTRLRRNKVLSRSSEAWSKRIQQEWADNPSEGEPRTATLEITHRAGSWSRKRRVVAVLVERNSREGELFHYQFYLCTSASMGTCSADQLLARYRQRGRAEVNIGELVNECRPPLSCTAMDRNQASALLAALAYQLMHHVRRGLIRVTGEGLSLRRLRERYLKVATQVVRHARRLVFRISQTKVAAWELLQQALHPPAAAQLGEGAIAN